VRPDCDVGAQADALEGRAADLGRLIVATESLVKLLPSDPPKPEASQRDDPRVVLWNIIKEGRERAALGFEGYDGKCKQIEALQGEIAALKAQLVGAGLAPALPDVVDRQVGTSGNLKTVITPTEADITPPSELGEFYRGVRPGPDDPPKRSPCIDGTSAPAAAAPAAYDYSANQDWKDWIEPDGSIRTTPRGRGKDWGPV
jgi:hypothetical protein